MPPSSTYSLVERTPRPTKLDAALMVGQLFACYAGNGWWSEIQRQDTMERVVTTHVADELGSVDDLDRPRNKILARWKVDDSIVDSCAVAILAAAVAVEHGSPDTGRVVCQTIPDSSVVLDISKDLLDVRRKPGGSVTGLGQDRRRKCGHGGTL